MARRRRFTRKRRYGYRGLVKRLKSVRRRRVKRAARMASRRVGRRAYYSIINPIKATRYVRVQRTNLQAYSDAGANAPFKLRKAFLINDDPGGYDMPQFVQYAALYEEFKVLSIKLTFRLVNQLEPDVGTVASYPTLYIRTSYDSAINSGAVTGFDIPYMARRSGVRRFTFSQERTEFHHTIYPRTLDRGQYDSSIASEVYRPIRGGWQDSGAPFVWYYGIEAILDYVSANLGLWVGVTWSVVFRNPRAPDDPGALEEEAFVGEETKVTEGDLFDFARVHAEKDKIE